MTQPPLYPITPQVATLPSPLRFDNGAELNVVPMPGTGIVRITVAFGGGRWLEKQILQSSVAADQITAGTADMAADVLSERLDFYGASLNAVSGIQSLVLTLTCMRRVLPQVLPLFKDIVMSPAYEQSLIDIEKDELMFASRANRQNVTYMGKKLLQKTLFGKTHPLAQSYDENDVEKLSRRLVLDYHHEFVYMENAVVYVSGDVDDDVTMLVNKYIGGKSGRGKGPVAIEPVAAQTSSKQRHDTYIDTEAAQSSLYMGCLLPSRLSPDYPAIALVRTIFGGYFGSRLMSNIRERLGLTYGISADILNIPGSSMMLVSTTTPYESVDQCIDEVFKEMKLLQDEPVGIEEMNMAKNYLMGQFCRTTEITLSMPAMCLALRESGTDMAGYTEMMKRVQLLTADDIMLCAQKYLQADNMAIAAAHGKRR